MLCWVLFLMLLLLDGVRGSETWAVVVLSCTNGCLCRLSNLKGLLLMLCCIIRVVTPLARRRGVVWILLSAAAVVQTKILHGAG